MATLALIRHQTSGDVYVAEIDDAFRITARTLPLERYEYESDGALLPDLDLNRFAVDWPEDEPYPDVDYHWLAYQEAGGDLVDVTR